MVSLVYFQMTVAPKGLVSIGIDAIGRRGRRDTVEDGVLPPQATLLRLSRWNIEVQS
jgi:hypothetical protein